MEQAAASFELSLATKQDIPRLAQIHVAACMEDDALKLYFASEDEFVRRVASMLEEQIGEPTWHHIRVVDKATGQIASWASWYTPTDNEIHNRDCEFKKEMELRKQSATTTVVEGEANASNDQPMPHRKGEFDFPGGLASYVKQEATRWLNSFTFNRRHIQARALFTDPPFERRGMATALIKWGNTLADQAALPCCVLATSGAWQLYVRYGWQALQHHDANLKQWAPQNYHDEDKHNYRFRYMLRLPEILSKS